MTRGGEGERRERRGHAVAAGIGGGRPRYRATPAMKFFSVRARCGGQPEGKRRGRPWL